MASLLTLVGKLDELTYSWDSTANVRGRLYEPRSSFKGSIELIAWDTLFSDARERNEAFFDRAGVSGESFFFEAQEAAHQRLRPADDKAAETTSSFEAASV